MRKLYILATFLITVVNVFSQTILDKPETGSPIVQDPTAVILTNGFHANSTTSNPFVAKIGASTEAIPTPTDSNAGAGNPSGIVGSNNFHDTQGNIEVNGGGQLQFTLPIALPPGVKSVAPQINLVYTSGSGNGIAGYGWNLSGITSITRMSKTIEKDGEVKGIQLDNTDYFSFNGQRLLLKSGEYGKDGAEYVTEKYSNVKIKSVGSTQVSRVPVYFEVTFEDGSQAWYGEIENDPEYNRYNARTAVEYNIVKWMDVQGNSILYTYDYTTGQMQGGVSRISTIRWGGNELLNKPHYNEIKFNYIDRDLKEESYVHGFRFLQDKLLSNIQVNTNGTQFKKYEISYKKDGNGTNYQYLDRITEYNSRGESANPVVFTNTVSQSSSWKSEFFYQNDDNDKITGDFDGDGKIDYLKYFDSYTQCTASEIQEVPYDDGTTNTYQSEVCTNWEEKPAGIYLVKGILDHSSGDKIYLGNSISKEDLTKAIIVSTKDNTGIVKSIPRLVVPKYFVNNNGTSDVEFRFYDIGSEISYLYSKFIPNADYDISNSSNGYDLTTSLGDTESIDVDGDGISELLVSFVDQECHYEDDRDPYNPYPINYCNENRRYFVLSTDPQIKSNYFNEVSNIYVFTSFSKDYKSGDFNGDGLVDYLRINYDKIPYLLQFKKDTSGKYIAEERAFNSGGTVLGLGDKGYVGDFNGDGKSDLIVPESEGSFNWNLYISDGGKFIQQSLPNFSYYRPFSSATSDGKTNYYFRSYVVQDLNLDGKSDFIELHSKTRVLKVSGQWSAFILNFKENKGIDGSGKIAFENRNIDGHSEAILPLPTWLKQTMDEYPYLYFKDGKWQGSSPKSEATIGSSNMKTLYPYSILAGNFRISDANRQIIVMNKQKRHLFSYYSVSETARISSITQGGIRTDIAYKELDGSTNPGFYAPVKKEPYPYVELEKVAQSYAVSQLRQSITVGGIEKIRKQDFRYRGFLAHLQDRGMIGFRQSARSSWYTDEFINTKIWSGAEIDPLKEGVPIKEWSIKTTDENQIFPSDLSVNNTKLLSFKSTDYRQDNLALGVKALVPVTTTSKDFLKNITTISSIIYNQYYLPTQTVTNTNSGFAIATTNLEYLYNPNGIGKDYYIGRPKSKTELMQAYGDSKGAKEEYEYDNNQLKTKTSWNRDNTGWIKETYLYDGFGNIIQKEATNSIDNNKKTEKAEYDTAGRFVVKKTDNLGLITSIKYNNWGQVEEQTDPLGVKLNNTYDGWGKILTSKTNLSGITSYTYEKQDNGDTKVTQYDPDGGETITFTNKIGQNYKTVTKSFNKGSYVSKEVGYDALGRKTYETEPRYDGKESPKLNTIEYDDYSRPVKAIAFTGSFGEYYFLTGYGRNY